MVLSLLSVAILLIAIFEIIMETVKAVNKGLKKSLVTLASIMLSIFLSLVLTQPVSNLLVNPIANLLKKLVNLSALENTVPSLPSVIGAYADALISPLIFLILFFLIRAIIAIVVLIVMRSREKKKIDTNNYENEDAPAFKKNPKAASGVVGFVCGILLITTFTAPIMGTLKVVEKTFSAVNNNSDVYGAKINSKAVSVIKLFSKDMIGNALYYCGGNLIYKASATSILNDNYFQLENEAVQTVNTADDLMLVTSILGNINSSTEEQRNSMKVLGKEINKAETLKTVAADIVPELSKNWLDGKPYLGTDKPKFNKISESVFNKMLYVCKSSTVDTVGDDLNTLLNVYMIAYENDMLVSGDYKTVIETASRTGAFDLIRQELNKNRRMAGITLDIDTMSIRTIASAIQSFNLENYDILMNNITNTLNVALKYEGEARKQYITDLTRQYINSYGINIGEAETIKLAEKLNDEVIGNKKSVSIDDVRSFWDKYSVKNKDNNAQVQQTPAIPVPDQTVDDTVEGETDLDTENEGGEGYPENSESDAGGYVEPEDGQENIENEYNSIA